MIGIDLIQISRMEKFIDRFQKRALQRFLSEEEILLVKNAKSAAGYWAVKEAFSKALGTGIGTQCSFYDMKIYKNDQGAPQLALSTKIIKKFHIVDVALSITHDGDYAIAVVAIEQSTTTNKIQKF